MRTLFIAAAFICVSLSAAPAFAYIGFGPGLTMIGSFFSLIATLFVVLGMVLLLPLRILLRRRKARKSGTPATPQDNPPEAS